MDSAEWSLHLRYVVANMNYEIWGKLEDQFHFAVQFNWSYCQQLGSLELFNKIDLD